MDQNQNMASAMTPQERPPTGALMGDIFRALTEHGFALEQHIESLRSGNRALQYAQRHTEEMHGKAQQTIDHQADWIGTIEALLMDAFALVGAAFSKGDQPISIQVSIRWMEAAEAWAERWHQAFPELSHRHLADGTPLPSTQPAQTDVEGVVHSHGQHEAHVHSYDDYKQHQQPIDQERILPTETDAEPTEGADPTCTKAGHLASSCEHAPDGGNHPAAPPAG